MPTIHDERVHGSTGLITGCTERAWLAEEFGGVVGVDDGVVVAGVAGAEGCGGRGRWRGWYNPRRRRGLSTERQGLACNDLLV